MSETTTKPDSKTAHPRDKLTAAAQDDVRQALKILAYAAAGGSRSKPTVAQLNQIVARLHNADKLLGLVANAEGSAQ